MAAKNKIAEFVSNYWLFGILLVMTGFNFTCNLCFCHISNEGIILTFVGILATFIVVSNYAQVKNLEDKIETYRQESEKKVKGIDFATILFTAQVFNKRSQDSFLNSRRDELIQLLRQEFPNEKEAAIESAVNYFYKIEYRTNIDNPDTPK